MASWVVVVAVQAVKSLPALPGHESGQQHQQGAGDEGRAPHPHIEPAKPLLRPLDTPRGDDADDHHGQRQAKTKRRKHTSRMVKAAGQGMSPPVMPNKMICGVVTARLAKRRAMSSACARSWASW